MLMKKICALLFSFILVGLNANASLTITAATGGAAISADKTGGAWTTLGAITFAEVGGAKSEFQAGTGVTLVFKAPAGFEFNTGATLGVVNLGGGQRDMSAASGVVTDSSTLTVTITVAAG